MKDLEKENARLRRVISDLTNNATAMTSSMSLYSSLHLI